MALSSYIGWLSSCIIKRRHGSLSSAIRFLVGWWCSAGSWYDQIRLPFEVSVVLSEKRANFAPSVPISEIQMI